MANLIVPSDPRLDTELKDIRHQSKQIRIQHCIKRFLIWRDAGLSPNEIKAEYGLSERDMYITIINAVQQETGIDRDLLLKYPKKSYSERCITIHGKRLTEDLSEAQQLIALYNALIEQADHLQHTISETINRR